MQRIRVGVDARLALTSRRGWGRYARELLRTLAELETIQLHVLVPVGADGVEPPDGPAMGSVAEVPCAVPPQPANLGLHLPPGWLGGVDLVHSLTRFVPPAAGRPLVATVHDIAPLAEPPYKCEYLEPTLVALDRLRRPGVHPVPVSAFTRHELRRVGGFDDKPLPIIGEGVRPEYRVETSPQAVASELERRFGLARGYLLYVGGAGPNKNLDRLIAAVRAIPAGRRPRLVLVGDPAWGYGDYLEAAGGLPWLEFVGYVDDRSLAILYRGACAFVAPSLHEGFGLPIIEAMASSCPVVCSDIPAFRETADGAALFFSPRSSLELTLQLDRLLAEPELGRRLAALGRKRSRRYCWRAVACDFEALYAGVLAAASRPSVRAG